MTRPSTVATLAFATLRGGVSDTDDTELFTATIKPADLEEGCVCDIAVLETDLLMVSAMLSAAGAEYKVIDDEPPMQKIEIDFGHVSVTEAIAKLLQLFADTKLSFDSPDYWYRFSSEANARPYIFTNVVEAGEITVIRIFQNLSEEGGLVVPMLAEQWSAYGAALRNLMMDAEAGQGPEPFFLDVEPGDTFVQGAIPSGEPDVESWLSKIADLFPRP